MWGTGVRFPAEVLNSQSTVTLFKRNRFCILVMWMQQKAEWISWTLLWPSSEYQNTVACITGSVLIPQMFPLTNCKCEKSRTADSLKDTYYVLRRWGETGAAVSSWILYALWNCAALWKINRNCRLTLCVWKHWQEVGGLRIIFFVSFSKDEKFAQLQDSVHIQMKYLYCQMFISPFHCSATRNVAEKEFHSKRC